MTLLELVDRILARTPEYRMSVCHLASDGSVTWGFQEVAR